MKVDGGGNGGETGEIELDGGGRRKLGTKQRKERAGHLRLAVVVQKSVEDRDGDGERRRMKRMKRRRRLAVEYTGDVPSTVDAIEDIDCPDTAEPSETCQKVTSTATLYVTDEDPGAITAQFERAMAQAIADGRLDAKLAEYNPSNEISSTSAAPPPVPTAVPPPDGGGEGGGQESRSLGVLVR